MPARRRAGVSPAHRGLATTDGGHDPVSFRTFRQRQAARCEAIARTIYRRYLARMLALAREGAAAGDGELQYRRAGGTYGGIRSATGDEAE